MIITWSHIDGPSGLASSQIESGRHEPLIKLLDKNMKIVFQSIHAAED